jgi:nicotinamidase/pyrazinamidase
MVTNTRIHLVVIDPQNDFCDIPDAEQPANPLASGQRIAPALPVPGANGDMLRLAEFIDRVGPRLYDVHVTLDSHNPVDIAHPIWWSNAKGEAPAPFTVISSADVAGGIWRARNPLLQAKSRGYVETLERNSRYALVIWPEHCLIGHWGHNIHAAVARSLDGWARKKQETVNFVTKGSNPYTEHYSAVMAEVPDPEDASTLLNDQFIATLRDADLVVIAGEALSHCVANTVRDIANNFGEENIKKLVILEDCASSVGGFDGLGADFMAEMTARGMQVAKSTDFLS